MTSEKEKIIRVKPVRELNLKGGRFLSAASGAILNGKKFYVVCDDENALGVFPFENLNPGTFITLSPVKMPEEKGARKKVKADWESIVRLPRGLLLVPSGSKNNRVRGRFIPFSTGGALSPRSEEINFSDLYKKLEKKISGLNIEGATATEKSLFLFHRGNAKRSQNAVIRISLKKVLKNISRYKICDGEIKSIRSFKIGQVKGVKLTVTDAAFDAGGRLWILGAAEDTESAVADGAYLGAVLARMNLKSGKLKNIRTLDCPLKPEGLFFNLTKRDRFFVVTDADNRSIPARLFTGLIVK